MAQFRQMFKNHSPSVPSLSRSTTSSVSSVINDEIERKKAYLAELQRAEYRLARLDEEIEEAEQNITSSKSFEEFGRKKEKLNKLKGESTVTSVTRQKILQLDRAIQQEEAKGKRVSHQSRLVQKEKKLKVLKEVNARKQVIELVMKSMVIAQETDLAFMLDCTGSMYQYIATVKKDIQLIVDNVKSKFLDATLNIAFVGYRDHCDGDMRIVTLPFTQDCNCFSRFVGEITATGGGDTAEDVFGGLEAVLKLRWSSNCRVLMHIADDPCHGSRFHYVNVDDEDKDNNVADRRGLRIENLISSLKQFGVKYYFGRIKADTDKMVQVFREVAQDPQFPVMINVTDTTSVASEISSSVCSSISASIDAARITAFYRPKLLIKSSRLGLSTISESCITETTHLKKYTLKQNEPDWTKMKDYKVQNIIGKMPSSFDNLQAKLSTEGEQRVIKVSSHPFAEGGQRISYKALDITSEKPSVIVLKEFKYEGDTYKDYVSIMETHLMAEFLAKEFSKVHCSPVISYISVSIVQFPDENNVMRMFTSEEILNRYEKDFIKWTNNTSFVNIDSYSDTVDAFSHWTYERTKGYLMICDLQGVQVSSNQYLLTDPAMHCTDVLRFGTTNLAEKGMKHYFRTHKCNDVCHKLLLKEREYVSISRK